jgi:hypothetical protein
MEQYRTAFCHDKKNDPLEYNLEKVVNLASIKLKELITQKQEKIKENNLLKGQSKVLLSDIEHYENEINEKESQILKLNEEYLKVRDEIEQIEGEVKENMDSFNNKTELYKHTVNNIKHDIDNISDINNLEESNKNSYLRQEYEELLNVKGDNKLLVEQLYQLRRDLYYLEVKRL